MRPIVVTLTGPGQSAWIPLDQYIAPDDVTLSTKLTGQAVYTIEATDEDPFQTGGVPSVANTFAVPGMENESMNVITKMPFTARAIRINNQLGTGAAGATRLTVLQAGIGGT